MYIVHLPYLSVQKNITVFPSYLLVIINFGTPQLKTNETGRKRYQSTPLSSIPNYYDN
jgi:hypothetical protein